MRIGEEKVAEVAYRLFKQRGVRSTNLQHIAKACGTSLFDLNSVYKSKKELVLAVVRYTLSKKASYLLINSSLSPSAVSELNNFFKVIGESIADLGADIFNELRRYNPEALDQLRELVDQNLVPSLQRNIERGLHEGFYRDSLDSAQYASTYFHILRTTLESERNWEETKKAVAQINDIFLHGVLNIKGMRI